MHVVNADDRPGRDDQAGDADEAVVCIELWRAPSGEGLVCRLRRADGDEFLRFDGVDLAEVARGLRAAADGNSDSDGAQPSQPEADHSRQREQRRNWKGAGNGPARPSATPGYVSEIEAILATAGWPPAKGR